MAVITQTLPMKLSPELDFDQNSASAFGDSLARETLKKTF